MTTRRKKVAIMIPALLALGAIGGLLLGPRVALWFGPEEAGGGSGAAAGASVENLKAAIETLRPLHDKREPPQPGDWLSVHDEPGQTFARYLRSRPVTPRGRRHVIYIQPLGDFTQTQRRIVTLTADFMGRYFNLPAKVAGDLSLSVIPDRARRVHPSWGDRQILSTYVLDKVLKPRLPDDAAAYLALTSSDLWPGRDWNFVFGQASLDERVGVWSIYRNGDPDASDAAFRLCLLRTLKTAAHETGHMFSMQHCIAHPCGMAGSNSRSESDARPLWLCPECMAKVCWATRTDPAERCRRLAAFCREQGLKHEEAFYQRSLEALGGQTAE